MEKLTVEVTLLQLLQAKFRCQEDRDSFSQWCPATGLGTMGIN